MRILIVAGETSGDILGAGLIKALKQNYPEAIFEGIAGPKMQAAGCKSLYPMETLSVMGIVEVIKHLPAILKVRKGITQYCLDKKPDIYIGIDAPDFNLPIETKLKKAGIKTVHYVSPSVWAWREGRVKKIMKACDLLLCLLPFEPEYYTKHGHNAVFVGHPLADETPMKLNVTTARQKLGLAQDKPVLAILPGSRHSEYRFMLELFLLTAKQCYEKIPDLQFVLPVAKPTLRSEFYKHEVLLNELPMIIVDGQAEDALAAADVVLLTSGTAALQSMLYKKPTVVSYKLSALTFNIVKWLYKAKYVSIPNVLADQLLMPEILQDEATVENLSKPILSYLKDEQAAERLSSAFTELHLALRQNASVSAASSIESLMTT